MTTQLLRLTFFSVASGGLSKGVWVKRHDDKAVVILKHPFQCHLIGTVKLSVLSGCVNILGAKLTANGQWHNLYSPSSHMLLKLTTEQPTGKDISQAKTQLSAMFSDAEQYTDLITSSVVVLLVSDLNWGFTDYIATIKPYQKLFQRPPEAEKLPYNKKLKPFTVSLLEKTEMMTSASSSEIDKFLTKWPLILKNSDCPKVLLCGGKNTGKSTFARILTNMALETKKAVCILDCDPGQTEFTPPGCVSLNVVKQFILGPPFCHQQDPAFNTFFGEVSPEGNRNHYMMCIRSAINYYLRMPERLPLIINTMGWIKGPGKKMLDGIINMIPPDHVVLLNSVKERVNPSDLLPKNVMKNQWRFEGEASDRHVGSTCNWDLTVLKSVVRNVEKMTKLSNADLRSLTILSYLGKNWSPGVSLNHNVPYKIKWSSLAIHVCQEIVPPSQILYAINASVVALCIADLTQGYRHNGDENLPISFQKRPICKCLGFGFVRGIQVETQMLYIVSPLPLNAISQVNTLLRGPIYLPLDRLQTQDITDLMYVDKTLTKTTGSQTLKKRQGIPRRN
ncbi:GRC3 [Acanthosepion pharaonis]|uniref:Polynucleotide 5'-hydroxyl-kinase NOL9 n=1 Tax=Acanthosepion pharaonis TaxID=158019 RepID=A0A812CIG6_ACAPH|nr:GRC3 [Sepia pharaonis]